MSDRFRAVLEDAERKTKYKAELLDIYNPSSIINAFNKNLIEQTYTSDYFVDYRADVEDPLAMLYQSGYLTIKGYDARRRTYQLDFPNDEVRLGFVTLIANSYFYTKSAESQNWIFRLDDKRTLHKIGVSISSTSRTVEEWEVE